MKSVWFTYAWDDNKDGQVDFVAQELHRAGLDVKLDRWNIVAGRRLWEQIASFIEDPSMSDAWLLYATQTSLGSEACKEEYAIALDRALHSRGGDFPVIALFPSSVDRDLIPTGIRLRLYVMLTDPEWKERIAAAVEGREVSIGRREIKPFVLSVHELDPPRGEMRYAIEVRPRAGTWSPCMLAIPANERARVSPGMLRGAAGGVPRSSSLFTGAGEGASEDGSWWARYASEEATPTQSYYLLCRELPSVLMFGVLNGDPKYRVPLM